jgi:hypothetical protein
VVLMVKADPDQVERELTAGLLRCPACHDRLVRWAYARWRTVRSLGGVLHPCRCGCGVACGDVNVVVPFADVDPL